MHRLVLEISFQLPFRFEECSGCRAIKEISLEECKRLLKEKFPKFIPYWQHEVSLYGEEGIVVLFGPFGEYAIEVIKANNAVEIKDIFDLVELLLCTGADRYP